MIVFPNCKINLGLRVLRKRADGYHDLETIFYPLSFTDALELIPATSFSFTLSGLAIQGNPDSNLCVKAYELLKKDYPQLPAAQIHLHKVIPTGAGLGGGSADAAFLLQLLNRVFRLELSAEALLHYSLQLGSDCPFFIINSPCLATSRGENLAPISLDLRTYQFILVNPGISISTAEAFAGITPSVPEKSIATISRQTISTWKEELINDFETMVFEKYPAIRLIKEELHHQGAVYASMSGTGSTVYGIFPKDATPSFSFPEHYFVKQLTG